MWDWIPKLEELRRRGKPFTLVTVSHVTGSTPREVGAKMLVLGEGEFHGTIGGGHLEQLAITQAMTCLKENKSQSIRYPLGAKTGQCCGGIVELLFEVLNQQPCLYVFGAGHVGQAVCRTMVGTPFSVHLIDERPEWIHSHSVPVEVIRHPCEWDDFTREASWDEHRTYVAIMTHRHDTDEAILSDVVRRPTRYLGVIGSESKWARFRGRLEARNHTAAELSRVRCPLGLPLGGGKEPQEIAVSLAAELLQTYHAS